MINGKLDKWRKANASSGLQEYFMGAFCMWVIIGLSNDRASAENVKKILENEGIMVKLKPISKLQELGTYEVLSLESEALEARDILSDCGII